MSFYAAPLSGMVLCCRRSGAYDFDGQHGSTLEYGPSKEGRTLIVRPIEGKTEWVSNTGVIKSFSLQVDLTRDDPGTTGPEIGILYETETGAEEIVSLGHADWGSGERELLWQNPDYVRQILLSETEPKVTRPETEPGIIFRGLRIDGSSMREGSLTLTFGAVKLNYEPAVSQ
jgi:hypothetical protein